MDVDMSDKWTYYRVYSILPLVPEVPTNVEADTDMDAGTSSQAVNHGGGQSSAEMPYVSGHGQDAAMKMMMYVRPWVRPPYQVPGTVEEDQRVEVGAPPQDGKDVGSGSSSGVSAEVPRFHREEMGIADDQQRTGAGSMTTGEVKRKKVWCAYEKNALMNAILVLLSNRILRRCSPKFLAEDMCSIQIWRDGGISQWNEESIHALFRDGLTYSIPCRQDARSLKRKWSQWVNSSKWPTLLEKFRGLHAVDRRMLIKLGKIFLEVQEAKRKQQKEAGAAVEPVGQGAVPAAAAAGCGAVGVDPWDEDQTEWQSLWWKRRPNKLLSLPRIPFKYLNPFNPLSSTEQFPKPM